MRMLNKVINLRLLNLSKSIFTITFGLMKLAIYLFILSVSFQLMGQKGGVSFPEKSIFGGTQSLIEAEEKLYVFRKTRTLDSFGGYKWYARFLAEYAKKCNSDGSLPSANQIYKTWEKSQTGNIHLRQSGNWFPIGPFSKPAGTGWARNYGTGRVNCLAFHPSETNTFFVGVAQGGIFKVNNGTITELNNGLPILRVSDICINPNNPNEMYCCLGDFAYCEISLYSSDRKRHTHYGMGIFKTTDGGKNWLPTGLSAKQSDFDGSLFRRVFIAPNNENEIIAVGISGIYKSFDKGTTWSKISNQVIGDIEQVNHSRTLYAVGRWLEFSNVGNAKMFKSLDFGNSWQEISVPWPATAAVTRTELAICPSDTSVIYALCVGKDGGKFYGIYSTFNAGLNWETHREGGINLMNNVPWLDGDYSQGKYDLALCVDPDNKEKIYFGGILAFVSENKGKDVQLLNSRNLHVDHHQFQIHPTTKDIWFCNDGGIYSCSRNNIIPTSFEEADANQFKSFDCQWQLDGLNIGAYYKIGHFYNDSGVVIAGAQDNGTVISNYSFLSGGDGMDCMAVQEEDKTVLISSYQYGTFLYFENNTFNPSFFANNDWAGSGEWTTPMITQTFRNANGKLSAEDHYFIYDNLTSQGTNFANISGFNDNRPGTAMDCSNFVDGYLYLAKKPNNYSRKPTKLYKSAAPEFNSFVDITSGLPDSIYVTDIATHPKLKNFAVVAFSGFVEGQKVYITKNGGATWSNASFTLPNIPINCIALDTAAENTQIYIGTDLGVYTSDENLKIWKQFSKNLPNVIISDLEIDFEHRIMYAATFGRALWACPLPKIETSANNNRQKSISNQLHIYALNKTIYIKLNEKPTGLHTLILLDVAGKKIEEKSILTKNCSILFNTVPAGLYYAVVKKGTSILQVEKVIIE